MATGRWRSRVESPIGTRSRPPTGTGVRVKKTEDRRVVLTSSLPFARPRGPRELRLVGDVHTAHRGKPGSREREAHTLNEEVDAKEEGWHRCGTELRLARGGGLVSGRRHRLHGRRRAERRREAEQTIDAGNRGRTGGGQAEQQ